MTNFIKKNEIKNNWILVDAENAIVGRLAAFISKTLRGKNKTQYTPNMDNGDFVIVAKNEAENLVKIILAKGPTTTLYSHGKTPQHPLKLADPQSGRPSFE